MEQLLGLRERALPGIEPGCRGAPGGGKQYRQAIGIGRVGVVVRAPRHLGDGAEYLQVDTAGTQTRQVGVAALLSFTEVPAPQQ